MSRSIRAGLSAAIRYTGRMGQAGVASHRNEVLATVMRLRTFDHLLQRAERLLATPPPAGAPGTNHLCERKTLHALQPPSLPYGREPMRNESSGTAA